MIKLAALLCKSHKREKKVYKREKKKKNIFMMIILNLCTFIVICISKLGNVLKIAIIFNNCKK